ncbi:SlyX family protein [Psychrobacter sp. S1-30-MNA-CIBAN-0213]|uniref:SlyX family protein n=1 Tax=unclassified Psychrobacter TaxID=196806 RepID=UPI00332A74DD
MNTALENTEDSTSQKDRISDHSELYTQMVELQMSMAHLELTIERLDEVVTRQDKHIHTLQRQLKLVYKQVESQSADDGIAPFDVIADRPPHY